MNAERLHAIAISVRDDLRITNTVTTTQQFRDALRNQVNGPQEASYQQQVATALQQLSTALPTAPSNAFPPTWRQALEELGIARLLGEDLLATIREVFERNQITPSVAADEIQAIASELEALSTNIDQLVTALDHFDIGSETLQPGEAEVDVLIPRAAVSNELETLGSELVELQQLLGPFLEMGTGSRPPLQIKTVSSSDFGVFIDVAPKVAALLAVAVERVVALYKSLLEIRRLRQELHDQGISDANLATVDAHANDHMVSGIDVVVDEMLPPNDAAQVSSQGRQNELRIELRFSLNAIANRIDRGYNIDVRATDPEPSDGTDETDADTAEAIQVVHSASPNLRFISRVGESILSLPEAESQQGD